MNTVSERQSIPPSVEVIEDNDNGCVFCSDGYRYPKDKLYFSFDLACWFHMDCLQRSLNKDSYEVNVISSEYSEELKG